MGYDHDPRLGKVMSYDRNTNKATKPADNGKIVDYHLGNDKDIPEGTFVRAPLISEMNTDPTPAEIDYKNEVEFSHGEIEEYFMRNYEQWGTMSSIGQVI